MCSYCVEQDLILNFVKSEKISEGCELEGFWETMYLQGGKSFKIKVEIKNKELKNAISYIDNNY